MRKQEQREHFQRITQELYELSIRKSAAYGDSYRNSPLALRGYGPEALFVEINAKYSRILALLFPEDGGDTGLSDLERVSLLRETFQDMANYSVLTCMLLDDQMSDEAKAHFTRNYTDKL